MTSLKESSMQVAVSLLPVMSISSLILLNPVDFRVSLGNTLIDLEISSIGPLELDISVVHHNQDWLQVLADASVRLVCLG